MFAFFFRFFNDYPLSGGPELAVSMFMLFRSWVLAWALLVGFFFLPFSE
jgi:hypothetical protein